MCDRRGVSTALGYVLNLGIATLVVTGLLVAGGSYVEDEREQTIRTELSVIGQQLAGDVETVDRLGRTTNGSDNRTVLTREMPRAAVNVGYTVTVVDTGSDSALELSTTDPDVTVRIEMATETDVADATVQGGAVRVSYDSKGTDDPSDDEVVVQNE